MADSPATEILVAFPGFSKDSFLSSPTRANRGQNGGLPCCWTPISSEVATWSHCRRSAMFSISFIRTALHRGITCFGRKKNLTAARGHLGICTNCAQCVTLFSCTKTDKKPSTCASPTPSVSMSFFLERGMVEYFVTFLPMQIMAKSLLSDPHSEGLVPIAGKNGKLVHDGLNIFFSRVLVPLNSNSVNSFSMSDPFSRTDGT